jgi:tRNA1(Val) A37 N6-methylase TrmN6
MSALPEHGGRRDDVDRPDVGDHDDGETADAFLGGRLTLLQPVRGFRAGIDAVLLAAAAPVGRAAAGHRVLDAGAGVGTAGLCLAARDPSAIVTLVEREPRLAALARGNVARNGFAARASVVEIDLLAPASELLGAGLAPESFDCILCNPPWYVEGQGRRPASDIEAAADIMGPNDLDKWLRSLARLAAPGATLVMVHRADALGRLLAAFERRFGGVVIWPLHVRPSAAASRIVVKAKKGSRAPMKLLHALALHETNGSFVPEIRSVLREGAALRWPDVETRVATQENGAGHGRPR